MNCILCKEPFSKGDIELIKRENLLNICDACEYNNEELHVKYDGADDLLDYLKKEVLAKVICPACEAFEVELLRIKFGNPIEGYLRCESCNLQDELDIHLEMV